MSLHNTRAKGECIMLTRPLLTAQMLHWNTQCTVKCVLSDLLTIWWTSTVAGATSLVEVSKVCNNYILHAKVCNKWFIGQSCDTLSALWLATAHMISNNIYYIANQSFDKFWSLSQIGSKMVNVCPIENTSWAN